MTKCENFGKSVLELCWFFGGAASAHLTLWPIVRWLHVIETPSVKIECDEPRKQNSEMKWKSKQIPSEKIDLYNLLWQQQGTSMALRSNIKRR